MGCRNLDEFWFGWMKVVLDWWIMFGLMFGIVWVKKFCGLVDIWVRYEGLWLWRFKRVVWEMRDVGIEEWMRKKDIFLGIWGLGVGHGRATTGTGRANLLAFLDFGKAWDGTAVPLKARAVPSFWHFGLNFFIFRVLKSCSNNYLQNNLKQTKTNKQKAIKCVGCLPRSDRLESLAWQLESVLNGDVLDKSNNLDCRTVS